MSIKKKKRQKDKRKSIDVNVPSMGQLMPQQFIPPPFDMRVIDVLDSYSLTFSDFSQAVGNLQFTPNTIPRIDIVFPESMGENRRQATATLVSKIVNDFWDRVYPSGPNGLTLDIIGQLSRTGAGSVEWVLNKDASQVNRAVIVPTKLIRFKTRADGSYYPIQLTSSVMTNITVRNNNPGEVSLDIPNYIYVPLETINGFPYGIPPFISVLKKLKTQDNIMTNIDDITAKLGLLGFVSIMADAPDKKPSESEDEHTARLQNYVDTWSKKIKQNLSKGVLVGIRDNMDIEYHAIAGDARGVQQVVQVLEEQIVSGFNQDPSMFGRTYSTTETYAGVVYDKFINMSDHYMRIVSKIIRLGLKFELQFNAVQVDDIKVVFEPPNSLMAEIVAKAKKIQAETVIMKRDNGIIDQQQAAKELGYDKPATTEPISPELNNQKAEENGDNQNSQQSTKNTLKLVYDKHLGRYGSEVA